MSKINFRMKLKTIWYDILNYVLQNEEPKMSDEDKLCSLTKSLKEFAKIALTNKPEEYYPSSSELGETAKASEGTPTLVHVTIGCNNNEAIRILFKHLKGLDGEWLLFSDMSRISHLDMSRYVLEKLTATGFRIVLIPLEETLNLHEVIMRKVVQLEEEGCVVNLVKVDPAIRMFKNRFKKLEVIKSISDFISSKNITVVTTTGILMDNRTNPSIRSITHNHNVVMSLLELSTNRPISTTRKYSESIKKLGVQTFIYDGEDEDIIRITPIKYRVKC